MTTTTPTLAPTTDTPARPLAAGTVSTVLAVILLGLSAGFFVTYTISVTRGLAEVGDAAYVESFQAINDRVRTASFATFFFGAAPVALVAAVQRHGLARWLLGGAAAVCAIGVVGVTFTGNVPLNETLATQTDPAAWSAAREAFEQRWNDLNLVRAGSGLGAFVLATLALAVPNLPRRTTR